MKKIVRMKKKSRIIGGIMCAVLTLSITASAYYIIADDAIFGVCQDVDAVNYLYEFTKSADGTWELSENQQLQDVGRYQDIYQSFSEYQTAVIAARG